MAFYANMDSMGTVMKYEEFIARRFPDQALPNPIVNMEALDFSLLYADKLKNIEKHIKAAGSPMRRLILALIEAAKTRSDKKILINSSLYAWFVENGMPKSHFGNIGVDKTLKRVYVSHDQLIALNTKMQLEEQDNNE